MVAFGSKDDFEADKKDGDTVAILRWVNENLKCLFPHLHEMTYFKNISHTIVGKDIVAHNWNC